MGERRSKAPAELVSKTAPIARHRLRSRMNNVWPRLLWLGLLLWPSASSADTVYLKDGRVVKGEVTHETDTLVRVRVDFGEGGFREMQYPSVMVDRIERASEAGLATDSEPVHRSMTLEARQAIYEEVAACYRKGLTGDTIWPQVSKQFGLSEDTVRWAYGSVLFKRRTPHWADPIRLKIHELLRSFDVEIVGEIIMLGRDRATIKYVDRAASWEAYEIVQRAKVKAPKMAQVLFDNIPQISRLQFEVQARVTEKTGQPAGTQRIESFAFTRP